MLPFKPKRSAFASRGFYQASSKQVRTLETFIAAEHFFAWIMLQFERGSHGTCDGNAQEIFDLNPRLCLHGSGESNGEVLRLDLPPRGGYNRGNVHI